VTESEAHFGNRCGKIEADRRVVKWMLGGVRAGILSLLVKAFVI